MDASSGLTRRRVLASRSIFSRRAAVPLTAAEVSTISARSISSGGYSSDNQQRMDTPPAVVAYPAALNIDYPDRPLDRLSTGFRLFTIIPIAIVASLLSQANVHIGNVAASASSFV